jgi:hypothetical protein
MKNVHLIATDKPSRLGYLTKKGKEVYKDLRVFDKLMPNILDSENQHIYITSDEKPKEGNWVDDGTNNPYKWTKNDVEDCLYNPGVANYKGCKKTILTTDQDLINDGVQAIDDEFLEWFVKNPSCEEVEIETFEVEDYVGFAGHTGYPTFHNEYKIIIPKEEPKPIWKQIIEDCGGEEEFMKSAGLLPKQETLEEAAARYTCGWGENDDEKAFMVGAKWQQERSQQIVPFDAYNIEVFAIKPDEQGKLFAYIGYNITNGNFHFNVVPFTEPKQEKEKYSEEDMTDYALYILHNNVITPKEYVEQFKNKGYEQ